MSISVSGLAASLRRVLVSRLGMMLLIVGALAVVGVVCIGDGVLGTFGWDFERAYRPAGIAVLHGHSPYPPATLRTLSVGDKFVYPPPSAFLFVPFALVPQWLAVALFSVLSAASLAVVPRLLGVRDWRVLAAIGLWPSVSFGLALGTFSLLLTLAVALAWCWRDRVVAGGLIVGAAVIAKLYLAPLALWLACTRRFRAALVAGATLAVLTLGSWAAIGFRGLREYPQLLSQLSRAEIRTSYSPAGVAALLGAPVAVATAIGMALALGLLVVAWRAWLRGAEIAAFCGVLGASLAGSPLVWHHYAIVLLVPIALVAPRLDALWFVPAFGLLSFDSRTESITGGLAFDLTVAVTLIVCARRDPAFAGATRVATHENVLAFRARTGAPQRHADAA
jgi:alpha-1,2-mannosyltransferase